MKYLRSLLNKVAAFINPVAEPIKTFYQTVLGKIMTAPAHALYIASSKSLFTEPLYVLALTSVAAVCSVLTSIATAVVVVTSIVLVAEAFHILLCGVLTVTHDVVITE